MDNLPAHKSLGVRIAIERAGATLRHLPPFVVERAVTDRSAAERVAVRPKIAALLVADLEQWLRSQREALTGCHLN